MVKYRLIERANPLNREEPMKWYAIPALEGTVTLANLISDIEKISSLSRGDVSNVLETLIDLISKNMALGRRVHLGEIGNFRVSFGSEGVDKPEDFHVSMIRNVRTIFTPSSLLRTQLSLVRFEQARGFVVSNSNNGAIPEEPGGTEEPGDI